MGNRHCYSKGFDYSLDDLIKNSAADLLFVASPQHTFKKRKKNLLIPTAGWTETRMRSVSWSFNWSWTAARWVGPKKGANSQKSLKFNYQGNDNGQSQHRRISTSPCGNLTPSSTDILPGKTERLAGKPCPAQAALQGGSPQLQGSSPGWSEHTSHTKLAWGSSRTWKQSCQHDHGKCCQTDPFPSKVKSACCLPNLLGLRAAGLILSLFHVILSEGSYWAPAE